MGMKASNAIATFFKYFVLILVGLIMIYPLLWMISATFKDNSEIFAGIGLWIKNPTLEGYKNALNNFGGSINILQAMLNTYSYVIPKVICTVVSACVAAYGFGRFDFPGRKLMFNIMLATLFLPQVVLNVPQYLLYNKFGWVDSYMPFWVPALLACYPFFIYQLIQFMRGIPRDLDESACIDGCGTFRIFWQILLPLMKPALFSAGLFQFLWTYNDYFNSLIFINSVKKYTISLALRLSVDAESVVVWGRVMAMACVAVLPLVLLFFAAQKYFVEGIATSGLKG